MNSPLVSVVMPVYNGQDFLREAIDSILNQSYSNFEFIILNDGSKDESDDIIKSYSDSRINYHLHQNVGLGATLNIGLTLCKGKYIARQDQDDVSYVDRFKKQVDYLEQNSNVFLLGTRAKIIGEDIVEMRFHNHAIHPSDLKFDLMFDNPFVHSSVMFRKAAIDKVGYYQSDRKLYEDFNLWSRFAEHGDVANLKEVLVDYRHHEKGISTNSLNYNEYALYDQGLSNIEKLIENKTTAISDIEALFHWKKEKYQASSIKQLDNVLDLIENKLVQYYPNDANRIAMRKKQYQKIIRYRLNVLERNEKPSILRLLILKAQNKLLKLHRLVINE